MSCFVVVVVGWLVVWLLLFSVEPQDEAGQHSLQQILEWCEVRIVTFRVGRKHLSSDQFTPVGWVIYRDYTLSSFFWGS